MNSRRRALQALALALAVAPSMTLAVPSLATAIDPAPVGAVRSFYDALLSAMKIGPILGFTGRRDKLSPIIRQTFDLALMTRLMVGPQWPTLTATQQQRLVAAFGDFCVATYASRFDDYAGERFDVDPIPSATWEGDAIVHTKLVPSDGHALQLDYLMRNRTGVWQIIDVYLSGTVSELATRRSEFSAVLRRSGPEALVDLLQQRTAKLAG